MKPNDPIDRLDTDDEQRRPDDAATGLGYEDDSGLDEELEGRLRHTSTGLAIVLTAMAVMVMSVASSAIIGGVQGARRAPINPKYFTWLGIAVWIGIIVSLAGKAKIRFDRRLFDRPELLDYSLGAGLLPFAVFVSGFILRPPELSLYLSMLGFPASYLLFVQFLGSLAAQYERPDLVRRAKRLLGWSIGAIATAIFTAGMANMRAEVPAVLFGLIALIFGSVSAFLYARLLTKVRNLM
jgi:hypothetical protein